METSANESAIEEVEFGEEPFYLPVGNETTLFQAAYRRRLPLLLKGPTGCGKTRFVEHMAHKLSTSLTKIRTHKSSSMIPQKTVGNDPVVGTVGRPRDGGCMLRSTGSHLLEAEMLDHGCAVRPDRRLDWSSC